MAAALVIGVVVGILDYAPRLFRQAPIAPGEKAPGFILESSSGERVSVADYLRRRAVVLVFFPGYQCASCRSQLGKLKQEVGRIKTTGTVILVIGDDAILDAKRIAAEVGPDIQLLMDRTMSVAHRYGMIEQDRATALVGYVVIDRRGRVLARRADPLFGDHREEIVNLLHEAARVSGSSAGP